MDYLYIAFAGDTIDDCVKPDLIDEWNRVKWDFFSSEVIYNMTQSSLLGKKKSRRE